MAFVSRFFACTSSQSYHLVYVMLLVPFRGLINHVFGDTIDCYIFLYLDNILVYSKTTNYYEKHLHEVFSQHVCT